MSTDTVLGIVLGGGLALCCAVLYCRRRARHGFLSFSSVTGVDEEDVRFQRRLEAATAGAFEGGGDDAELELTAKEIQAIQSLEVELREMRSRRQQQPQQQAAAVMAPLPPQAAAAVKPSKSTAARAAAAQAVGGGGKVAVVVAEESTTTAVAAAAAGGTDNTTKI